MRHQVGMTDMAELMAGTEADIEAVVTAATRDGTEALKEDWRDQIRRAGLGSRLALTVRGATYPQGTASLDAVTWVWTKAPRLIDAYDRGPTIRPTDGRYYMAIPTKNVPRKGRGRRMTPLDVEVAFNQDLIVRPGRHGNLLAFVDTAFARYSRSQGRAYPRRKQIRPGKPKLVLMFTLVRQVRVRKRLDVQLLANRAADRWPGLLARRWQGLPDRTASMKGM